MATKKVLPYTLSAIVKLASQYSYACSPVNQAPSRIVISSVFQASFPSPRRRAWWDQVREAPEDRSIAVLSRGTPQGWIGFIPVGGQVIPISAVGDRALWKKAQKNEKKNITSEATNKMNPIFIPRTTYVVCIPRNVASRTTSRHQKIMTSAMLNRPRLAVNILSPWNQLTNPVVTVKAATAPAMGQGLRSTM